ncbi:MAG: hypothetical protein AVDCRST_MAG56-2644, partial [uncultured Cytophagales bacterium]
GRRTSEAQTPAAAACPAALPVARLFTGGFVRHQVF